jgi:DNA/RNA endonuclease YhcR with UshA esterase domain
MKIGKFFFIISLIGISTLLLIASFPKTKFATVKSISYSENKIEIITEEFNETLIIFNTKYLELKNGDKIIFLGKHSEYKNKKQIIVDKIEKAS